MIYNFTGAKELHTYTVMKETKYSPLQEKKIKWIYMLIGIEELLRVVVLTLYTIAMCHSPFPHPHTHQFCIGICGDFCSFFCHYYYYYLKSPMILTRSNLIHFTLKAPEPLFCDSHPTQFYSDPCHIWEKLYHAKPMTFFAKCIVV